MPENVIFYGDDSPLAGQIKERVHLPDPVLSSETIAAMGNADRVASIRARAKNMIKNGDATGALALLSTIGE